MDEIICFGMTFEGKLEKLEEVFKRLVNANLKLKPKKVLFVSNRSFIFGLQSDSQWYNA